MGYPSRRQKLRQRFDLFFQLSKASFEMRYNNSVLGVLWVLIKPYLTYSVLIVIWSQAVNQDIPNFPLYVLTGMIMFNFINESIMFGHSTLLDKSYIILKVHVSKRIALASSLSSAVINFTINILLLIFLLIVSNISIGLLGILNFFILVAGTWLIAVSISAFLSVATVRFRDVSNILELFFFLFFWMTPILYSLESGSVFTGNVLEFLKLNPLATLFTQARISLGILPGEINLLYTFAVAGIGIVSILLINRVYEKLTLKVSEYI